MKSKNNEQIYTKLLAIILITTSLRLFVLFVWIIVITPFCCSLINLHEYIGWIILYSVICVFSAITLFLFVTKVIAIILTNKDYPFPKKVKVKFAQHKFDEYIYCISSQKLETESDGFVSSWKIDECKPAYVISKGMTLKY